MFLENNNKIRKDLFQAIKELTDEQFNKTPTNGGWSPKQIFEHLVRTEITIGKNIARVLKSSDSLKAKKKPIQLATSRLIKIKAPSYTVPTDDFKSKEEMKRELHESRLYLLDIYQSSTKEIFEKKSFKHPLFGNLSLMQWFPFVGLHEKRHLKQLKKTIEMN
jgi:hypothetical protein